MIYDALIFDVDGTLWNASPASAKGWTLGLEKLGIDRIITAEQIETVAGKPHDECIDILMPGLRVKYPNFVEILDDCETTVMQSEGGVFYKGTREGVAELALDHRIFLISNCQDWYLDLFLDFSGLRPILSGFDCYGRSGLPKSDMLTIMKRTYSLEVPVYIGDTSGDRQAAELAGIPFIHAAWGFGKADGGTISVPSFAALLTCLRGGKC